MKPLVLCLLSALPATARLGETPEQCKTRYGTVVEEWKDGSFLRFAKGMVRVECTFDAGRCVVIEYQLATPGAHPLDYDERFNEAARAALLEANQGGSRYIPWKMERPAFQFDSEGMKTEDGKRRAYLSKATLRFEVVDYIEQRRKGVSYDAIKAALDGF